MKVFKRIFLVTASVFAIALFVSFFKPSVASAQTAQITLDATNSGDAGATVNFYVVDTNNVGVGQGSFFVGPNTNRSHVILDSPIKNPYRVIWEPIKQYGVDSRDVNCTDPITTLAYAGSGFGGGALFIAKLDFACWIPGSPPPTSDVLPYSKPANLTAQSGCFGSAPFVTFRWHMGTDAPVNMDISENNFSNLWFRNMGGTPNTDSSFTWSFNNQVGGAWPTSGHVYQWRLWDGVTHTVGPNVTIPNCYQPPQPNPPTAGCFGNALGVNFSWNLGTNTPLYLDVSTNSSFNGFWNVNVGSNTSFDWNVARTISGQAPQPSTRYYWRLWDGQQHSNGSSFVTPNCGGITLNPPNATCVGTQAIIDFSWTSTTGGNQYQIWRDGVYFATTNGLSWRYNAPASDQGQFHQWYIYDAAVAKGSSARLVTTPVCTSTLPPITPPPTGVNITLDGNFTCPDRVVHLRWTVTGTIPTSFTIFRNGVAVAGPLGANIDKWDSGPNNEGDNWMWSVYVGGINKYSSGVQKYITCPPTGGPGIIDLTAQGICDSTTPKVRLSWTSTTGDTGYDILWSTGSTNTTSLTYTTGPLAPGYSDVWTVRGRTTRIETKASAAAPTNCAPPPTTPPPSAFNLTGRVNCPARTVTLNWTSSNSPSSFNIVYDGVHITSVLGSTRSWSTGAQAEGERHTYQIYRPDPSGYSNAVSFTVRCAATPPPTNQPNIPDLEASLAIVHADTGKPVTMTKPASPGERLRARLGVREQNGIRVRSSFYAYYWADRPTRPGTCNPTDADKSYPGIITNPPPLNEDLVTFEQFDFDAPIAEGTYNSRLFVDGRCQITESDEGNNTSSLTYRVVAAAQPDLQITPDPANSQQLTTGQPATYSFIVKNNSSFTVNSANVGFWSQNAPDYPCDNSPLPNPIPNLTPEATTTVASLNSGQSQTMQFTFNTPSSGNTASAYVNYACSPIESNFGNNAASTTYAVNSGAWMQTEFGDVGAVGSVNIKNIRTGKNLSSYLLASKNNIKGLGAWNLSAYAQPLVPQGKVYDFFNSRFGAKAQASANGCNLSGGLSGYYYCENNVTINVSTAKPASAAVVFVKGNLVFENDYEIGGSATIVFVVSGNIVVNSNVNKVDAVLVSGTTFFDCSQDSSGCASAQQLQIKGSVYTNSARFERVLSSGNDDSPALFISFQPKYLIAMTQLLGSPSISWKEIAP